MKEALRSTSNLVQASFASHSDDVCWKAKSENARVLQKWRGLLSRRKEAGNGMEEWSFLSGLALRQSDAADWVLGGSTDEGGESQDKGLAGTYNVEMYGANEACPPGNNGR